jgi:aminoglycoside phosphotransferase (APT) family kinase protein
MNTREPSLRFDVAGLERYLTAVITGFRGPIAVQQFVHGQSNPTYLLETESQRYVLRRKPPGVLLPSAHAVDREFRVMRALLPTGVPVPRTLCYCDDDAVIGTEFYIMEYVEGRILQDGFLPSMQAAERAAIYAELNRVIAALHRVEPVNIGLGDFGKHGGYVARQVARWTKQYRASEGQRIDAMERLIDWLPQHIPAEQPSRITHGDYRLDNVIFHPSRGYLPSSIGNWPRWAIRWPISSITACRGGCLPTSADRSWDATSRHWAFQSRPNTCARTVS